MKIRELENADFRQVIEIWKKSFNNNFDKEINSTYLTDPSSITLVSVDSNTVTGVASLHIIKTHLFEWVSLLVHHTVLSSNLFRNY